MQVDIIVYILFLYVTSVTLLYHVSTPCLIWLSYCNEYLFILCSGISFILVWIIEFTHYYFTQVYSSSGFTIRTLVVTGTLSTVAFILSNHCTVCLELRCIILSGCFLLNVDKMKHGNGAHVNTCSMCTRMIKIRISVGYYWVLRFSGLTRALRYILSQQVKCDNVAF